jgi:phosphatidate cytidylyltransferase
MIAIESVSGNFEMSMESITLSLFSYVLLGIFAPLLGLIKRMDMSGWILAILLLLTILTDTGGWLFGKLFGRHKVKFLSSPNKTIEGFFGALILGVLTGTVIFIIQNIFSMPTKFTLPEMAFVTFSVIIASVIGDLGESTIKRWAHMKDSSDLLPGHGGFFDRFDSLIFSTPVYFVIMKLMGY